MRSRWRAFWIVSVLLVLTGISRGAENSEQTFSFVHITDGHVTHPEQEIGEPYRTEAGQNKMLAQAVEEINAIEPRPAFAVYTGDMIIEDGRNWQNPDFVNVRALKLMKGIMDKLSIPWYPALGNHDQIWLKINGGTGKAEEQLKEILGFPPYYSFDYAHGHLVVLNSSQVPRDHGRIDGEQMDWLKEDLEKNKDKVTLLFMHHLVLPIEVSEPIASVENADALLGLLGPYPLARWFFSGHWHGNKVWKYRDFKQVLTTSIAPWAHSFDSPSGYRLITVNGKSFSSKVKVLGGDWLPEVRMEDFPEWLVPYTSYEIGAYSGMMVELRARKAGELKPFGESPPLWNLLSWGKPVTASASDKNYSAEALTDGIRVLQIDRSHGRWESGPVQEEAWIEIDLQDIHLVNEVVLEWLGGLHAKKMTVEVSKDQKDYAEACVAANRLHMGWNCERDRLVFDPVEARFAKVRLSGPIVKSKDTPPMFGLWEVEVYGKGSPIR